MVWVVAALTVVVGVLTLFVLGLLRSHAELLRRTAELAGSESAQPLATATPAVMPEGVVAAPDTIAHSRVVSIDGLDWELERYRLAIREVPAPYLLVAFLSTNCLTCLDIWRDIIEAGDGAGRIEAGADVASVMIVLKGREHENLGKAAALAAKTHVPVVFSGQAWSDLEVSGSPYFALIATAEQRVVGAGSARSWGQLKSLAGDGMLEIAFRSKAPANGRRGGYRSIIEHEDDALRKAGILPGHPSLTASPLDDELDGPLAAPAVDHTGEHQT